MNLHRNQSEFYLKIIAAEKSTLPYFYSYAFVAWPAEKNIYRIYAQISYESILCTENKRPLS